MIYYDTLNNAELFATYAFAKPVMWKRVIEKVVTHGRYGNGTIKEKNGVIFQIQFPDQLRCFCELDFFGSDFAYVQFTNISLPPNLDRDELIDTLHCWEIEKAGRLYRGPYKHYRRLVRESEWLYQQRLVKREEAKIQQQQERVIRETEQALLREKQQGQRNVDAGNDFGYYHQNFSSSRDEM